MTDDPKGARAGRGLIRLPQPTVRPEVEARRKAGADLLAPTGVGMSHSRTTESSSMLTTPYDVVNWLHDRGIEGAVVFRVPVDPTADVFHGM